MSEFAIRPMSRSEVDLAVDWAAAEGWNPGLHDADSFYAADPEGFLLGLLDGEPVGCISAVRGERFGFIGFYIVRPELRGRGYGLRLWNAAMKRLAGCNVGLDGVIAQQDNYRKSGFQLAYRNIRYEGRAPAREAVGLLPLADVPFDELLAFDTAHIAESREAFLRAWIEQPGSIGLAARSGGRLSGYGVVRPCRVGCKIGPLFVDQAETADRILCGLSVHAGDGPIYLDVPELNRVGVALAERYGMTPMFETARMYTADEPGLPVHRIFGVTTFELG